jgi:hypothetical protein
MAVGRRKVKKEKKKGVGDNRVNGGESKRRKGKEKKKGVATQHMIHIYSTFSHHQ